MLDSGKDNGLALSGRLLIRFTSKGTKVLTSMPWLHLGYIGSGTSLHGSQMLSDNVVLDSRVLSRLWANHPTRFQAWLSWLCR